MQEQKPSATAAGVALLRVLHQKVDGEPMQSFLSEETLAAKLRQAGFGEVLFVSPAEVAARYLGERTDGLKAPRRTTLARARI